MTKSRPVHLIGAPSDVGASIRGSSMGPEALRVARIERALRTLGLAVVDTGILSGPPNPDAEAEDGYRHLSETADWCAVVHDAVTDSLSAGATPVLLGGDHALSVGSIGAVARHCDGNGTPLSVLWLDAHADFNTPLTSPSGNLHGMPVAILTGEGPPALTGLAGRTTPALDSSRVVLIGVRSIDHVEKRTVVERGLTVHDMRTIDERGMREVMEEELAAVARRGGHLHVSLDVDFLDPTLAPGVNTPEPGGPTYREAQLCMEMIYDLGLLGSVDIMELNPARDVRNQTAELVVELIASLFGEQILGRHRTAHV